MNSTDSSEWNDDQILALYATVTKDTHLSPELIADYVQNAVTNQRLKSHIRLHASVCHDCAQQIEVAKALFSNEQVDPEHQIIANQLRQISTKAAHMALISVSEGKQDNPTVFYENVALTIRQVAKWGSKKLYDALVAGPGTYQIRRYGKTFDFALGLQEFTVTPATPLARGIEGPEEPEQDRVSTFSFSEIGVVVRFFPGRKCPDGSSEDPHFDIEVSK